MSNPSRSASELGIENGAKAQTLTGHELPSNWPAITPDSGWRDRFVEFRPGVDRPIERFSLHLESRGGKSLAYLAVEHTNNPDNPQFAILEGEFNNGNPQVVLHEGPVNNNTRFTDRETALSFGEVGFLTWLVQEHNDHLQEGEVPVVLESTDMSDEVWIQSFRDLDHSNEEIAVFDVLRKINVVAEQFRRNTQLSQAERAAALEKLEGDFRTDFFTYLASHGFPNLFSLLPRHDGREWSVEVIREEVKELTGQDMSSGVTQLDLPRFKSMFDEETEFRDKFVVEKIAQKMRKVDRVMAAMGSSHVLREEKALRIFFGEEAEAQTS